MAEERPSPRDAGPGLAWVARWAEELRLDPPDDAATTALLDLAGVAAHASERLAAPLACYLVGRAGLDPVEALEAARRLIDTPSSTPEG